MKRVVASTAVLAWVIAVLAALPALAQETPGSGAATSVSPGEAPPVMPYFAYNGDGTVTIDGDVGVSCYDFALTEGELTRSVVQEGLAQNVLVQCEQTGFLSPDNRYAAYPPDQRQQPSATQAELPATGGLNLLAALAAGAGFVGFCGLAGLSRR